MASEKKAKIFQSPVTDLSNVPVYSMSWDKPVYRDVYGYQVQMPDMPPKKEIVNYGLPLNEQVFRRTLIPEDLKMWPEDEMDAFIAREHHRRYHGMWYYIKGEPLYIPGTMYFFMNYWVMETGKQPIYRFTDLKFFWIWMHVVRSPKIYGLAVFKCRRIGDTEKSLCMIYEYASRVRNTLNAMQDARTELDVEKAYRRLINAHNHMIWYMKPINRGSTNPKKSLEFTYPEKKSTINSNISKQDGLLMGVDDDFEYPAIGSEVLYYPSKPESGDGKRHGRYYCDEFGKKKMLDALAAWGFVKKSLRDEIYNEMAGKGLFTSTIEEMKDGESLKISKKLWNDSDPNNLNDRGETITGLIRIVRGALERGSPDRWGYCDEEGILKSIKQEQEFLVKQKKWTDLIQHKRQNCIDISDIFSNISDGSAFNIETLTMRQHRLEYEIKPNPWIRGNFEFKNNIVPVLGNPNNVNKKCRVEFIPCDDGRFYVSGYPDKWGLKDNAMDSYSFLPKPRNIHAFAMGIDPVSQKDVLDESEMSLSAFTIKRLFDPVFDGSKFDERGNPIDFGENFATNRYCCIYLYRHMNPEDNYMDWLKAMIFYGTDFLIEKNKGDAFLLWMESYGFDGYYQDLGNTVRNYSGKTEKHGLSASEKTINTYFNLLRTISDKWYNTIDFPLLCDDMRSTSMGNQTKHDLTVSAGYCEIAAQNKTYVNEVAKDEFAT
jgi:hypothetical protein